MSTPLTTLSALAPMLARRVDLMSTLRRLWQDELAPVMDDAAEGLDGAFARELERLAETEVANNPELFDAALHATGACLAKRGVPLGHLLAMSACSGRAATLALGDAASPEVLRALGDLEVARAAAYARAYRAHEAPPRPRCTQPLASLRRGSSANAEGGETWGIVGQGEAIQKVRAEIQVAAQGPRNVLVTGESGSGKELVARAIHEAAGGERGKFVPVHCAALPGHLVESELFGHVRGAFTGASGEYPGLFRTAAGGTLFLDEVTETTPEVQAKLLGALEERTVRPVGSSSEIAADVRVIASTNRDLAEAVSAGKLRSDLSTRLQSFTIHVPALRERREDIGALAEHFLASFCHRRCGCIWGISQRALEVLLRADWPGNVRELRSAIEHAVTTGDGGLIEVGDLPRYLWGEAGTDARPEEDASLGDLPSLEEAESELIRATLDHFAGNKVRAAHSLGISRHKLYDRLRKLGLGQAGGPD